MRHAAELVSMNRTPIQTEQHQQGKQGMISKIVNHIPTHLHDYIVVVLVLTALIIRSLGEPPEAIPAEEVKGLHILTPVKSLSFAGNNANVHNSVLLSVLLQKSSKATTSRSGSEAPAVPAPIIFSAILAALVPILFKLRAQQPSWQILAMLLFLIALLFFLDVLREDATRINFQWDSITDSDIQRLTNVTFADTTWYELTYDTVGRRFEQIHNGGWSGPWRKIRLACQLKMERIIYFIVPWFLVYLFARTTFRQVIVRLRRTTNSTPTLSGSCQ